MKLGLRGVVDVKAGTLTFGPLGGTVTSRGPRDVGPAAIYGDQGVTVRLYNSSVIDAPSSTAGKETYTANVGIQNLLAFPIGDEQAGVPLDTMGVYVFVNSGPTVTGTSSPCSPGCAVTVGNAHGHLTFNQPSHHIGTGTSGSARSAPGAIPPASVAPGYSRPTHKSPIFTSMCS